jgi:hypothetical protein
MEMTGCCGKADLIRAGEASGRSILLATMTTGRSRDSMIPTIMMLTCANGSRVESSM